jgi:hypothetical protein
MVPLSVKQFLCPLLEAGQPNEGIESGNAAGARPFGDFFLNFESAVFPGPLFMNAIVEHGSTKDYKTGSACGSPATRRVADMQKPNRILRHLSLSDKWAWAVTA